MTRVELESLATRLFERVRSRVAGADSAAFAADIATAARLIRGLAREPGGEILTTRILSAPSVPSGIDAAAEGRA